MSKATERAESTLVQILNFTLANCLENLHPFKLLAMYLEVMGDLKKVIDGSKMRRKHPLTRRAGWTCGFFVVCLYKIFTSSIA